MLSIDRKIVPPDYEMNVLIVYKKGAESYKEVIHDCAHSLCVNTHAKAVSHTEFNFEDLKKYDLIYPDVSLVDVDNREEIANNLIDYVKNGGNLFLEEDLYKMFPNDVLGISKITEVNLFNQTFDFPVVPEKHENLQKLWEIYSIKTKTNIFYDVIRYGYHKFKGDHDVWAKSSNIYDINLTKVNLKIGALPSTATSLVNSNEFTLLSINKHGEGTVLWTVNHIPKRGTYFGKPFMTRLDLGYPDKNAKNFHFGYATINYLMRNAYLDFITKEKYGFSIQKVFGAYGRPSFSWQNHLDFTEVWENDEMIRWINILKDENQIPTFSVIRKPVGCSKDMMSEHGAPYAINSLNLINKVRKNVNYALNHSICINPHYYVGCNYTFEQELHELAQHKRAFTDLGIPWTKTLGTNHHGWNAHPVPMWQTIYTEKNFGLIYDFGWHSMAADFKKLPCTTPPYMPYGMPFLLMKNDTKAYPFVIWTPNTRQEHTTFRGKSGLFLFPLSFDLPITYYFHPEYAFGKTKKDILFSYLMWILKYKTVPTRLDLHSGEAYNVIRSFNKLREEHEYNMMSEEQAAKAMLNMYYTKIKVKINGSKLILIPNTDDVPGTAEEYKNTLGIKIELHPDYKSNGITTDSSIYYKPASGKIYFGLYKKTHVGLNKKANEEFHLVRCNAPFELKNSSNGYEITVKSAGMRQFKIFSPYSLQGKNDDVVFEKKGDYYVITAFGSSNKAIYLVRKNLS